jgi:hypothetical protein
VATDDRTIQVVSAGSGARIMTTSSLIKVRPWQQLDGQLATCDLCGDNLQEIYVARKELQFQGTRHFRGPEAQFEDAGDYFDMKHDD